MIEQQKEAQRRNVLGHPELPSLGDDLDDLETQPRLRVPEVPPLPQGLDGAAELRP